jgi:hypothetical protein
MEKFDDWLIDWWCFAFFYQPWNLRSSLNFCIRLQVCCCDWLGSFGYKYKTIGWKNYLFTSRTLVSGRRSLWLCGVFICPFLWYGLGIASCVQIVVLVASMAIWWCCHAGWVLRVVVQPLQSASACLGFDHRYRSRWCSNFVTLKKRFVHACSQDSVVAGTTPSGTSR